MSQLINVFEDINKGNFIKINKVKEILPPESLGGHHHRKSEIDQVGGFSHGQVVDLQKLPKVAAIRTNGDMQLEHVAVITPSGDVVVPNLSLRVCHLECTTNSLSKQCFLPMDFCNQNEI